MVNSNIMKSLSCAQYTLLDPDEQPIPTSSVPINLGLLKNLESCGFEQLYPVQYHVLRYFIESKPKVRMQRARDICISSPTGTGKTLCYAIPIINELINGDGRSAMVIVPTYTLCQQISDVLKKLCMDLNIKVYNMEEEKNYSARTGIYVVTPNEFKLLLINGFLINELSYLVLDEADKLFGPNSEVMVLLDLFKSDFQSQNMDTFLFKNATRKIFVSATLKSGPDFVTDAKLFVPMIFKYNESENLTVHPNLQEFLMRCDSQYKPLVFIHVCLDFKSSCSGQILCFINNIDVLERLNELVSKFESLTPTIYHQDLKNEKKTRNLNAFKRKRADILITTDHLARGIDMDNIGMVVNYDAPFNPEIYVHRIGRTCRGSAVTIVEINQQDQFTETIKKVKRYKEIVESKCEYKDFKYLINWYQSVINTIN